MTVPASVTTPLTEQKLRCSSCGASYPSGAHSEILTCAYCGSSARMVDARAFLDHFLAQVTAFVRQAVPAGLDVTGSGMVDPVARLAAFNSSVRPRLSTATEQYRFSCSNLLSSPLAVQPFGSMTHVASLPDPTAVSVFIAQVQSVSGLASDDTSRDLVRRAGGIATCYQSLLVALRLAAGSQPERFHLIAQNYTTAAEAIRSTGCWTIIADRLTALEKQCRAVDSLVTGTSISESKSLLGGASQDLTAARSALSTAPDLGYMTSAIDQELSLTRAVGSMSTIVEGSASVSPPPLVYIERLSRLFDSLAATAPAYWAPSFRSLKLREEVFRRAAELRSAQAGRGTVKVLALGAGTLVPFWVVELPYTIETGVLWTKRGREVPEVLLVAATFPSDPASLAPGWAWRVLTNVFAAAYGGPVLSDTVNRLRGNEQTLSRSSGLAQMVAAAAPGTVGGFAGVPPLTTEAEALKLVQVYLEGLRSSSPKAAAQLRASSPRVVDLVYVPCNFLAQLHVPGLGGLSPASVGDPQTLMAFVA